MDYDWKKNTFSLTIDDAAKLLKTTRETVVDLMISGQIGFYMEADPERDSGLPLDCARFDPQDLTAFFRREHEQYASVALPVLTNLRQYLRKNPTTMNYEDAVGKGRPLRTRAGLHVRTDAVVQFARLVDAPPAAQMHGSTETAFVRLGLLRVRGLTPFGDRQRWGYWYRLPQVIEYSGQKLMMNDFLRPRQLLSEHEREIAALDGSGPVVAQPIHGDM